MIKSVYKFNTELLGVKTGNPHLLKDSEQAWLMLALREELNEFDTAHHSDSLVDSVDALLDLVYFAIGGCVRMGLTAEQIEECFNTIHQANMNKKMGVKESRPQDGSVADAIKPTDWVAPEEKMKAIIFPVPKQMELDL